MRVRLREGHGNKLGDVSAAGRGSGAAGGRAAEALPAQPAVEGRRDLAEPGGGTMPGRCRPSGVKGRPGVIVSAQPSAEKQFTGHAACSPRKFLKFFRSSWPQCPRSSGEGVLLNLGFPLPGARPVGVGRTPSGIDCAQGIVAGAGGRAGADGWAEGRSPKTSLLRSSNTGRRGKGTGVLLGGCGFTILLAHPSGPPRSQMREPRLTGVGRSGKTGLHSPSPEQEAGPCSLGVPRTP